MVGRPARSIAHFAAAFLCASIGCSPAQAPADAGDGSVALEAAVGACGIAAAGECVGETLRRCEGAEVVEVDCTAINDRAGGRCVTLGTAPSCAVEPGAPCRFVVDHGDHQHISYAGCAGEQAACVLRAQNASACVERQGGCDGTSVSTCRGSLLILDCRSGQPLAYDCAALGGSCDATRGACGGLPAGAACDRSTRLCATGATCQFPRGRNTGVCTAD